MKKRWKVIHYVNQFFAQVGGEEAAFMEPKLIEGAVGPGLLLKNLLGDDFEIVATTICGDNYIAENTEKAVDELISLIGEYKPDIFIAGPAFNAGRYGPGCGAICKEISEKYKIPSITGMYEENPGVEMYRKYCYIVKTKNSAAGMRKDMPKIANLAKKIMSNEELMSPEEENYFAKGFKRNVFVEENGAKRSVNMLLAKLRGEDFITELELPKFETVKPAKNIDDASKACIALVTEGGITDINNSENLESARATKYLEFDISNMNTLSNNKFKTVHGGFNNTFANEDPNRVIPVDVMRLFEKEKIIGKLHNKFYSTSGNSTSIVNSQKFGAEIAQKLKSEGVDAVILTST